MGLKVAWGLKKDSSLNEKQNKTNNQLFFLDILYTIRESQPEAAGP